MDKLNHIRQLDAIRGIAILLVFIAHFFTVNESALLNDNYILGTMMIKFSLFGLQGVVLFFMLSGYLITRILLNSKHSPNFFTNFYMRRSLRILPLYYLVLFLSLVVYPYFVQVPESANEILAGQWKLWMYVSNVNFYQFVLWDSTPIFPAFGHFWTLSVEEHFYLLWPLLIYFSFNKKLPTLMSIIFLISLISWAIGHYIEFFMWSTLRYASALVFGGLIAYYEYVKKDTLVEMTVLLSQKYHYILLFLFAVIVIPRSFGYIGEFITYLSSLLIFGAFIITALYQKIVFLNSKFLIFIGKISYGIYVYHGVLRPFFKEYIYMSLIDIFGVEHGILVTLIYTLLSLIITVSISWLSWHFFEKKVLKLKRYYSYD